MKKLIIASFALLFGSVTFAQDLSEALQAKNAGNEAYRNKEYVKAIQNYEKYLASNEEGVAEDSNTKNLYENSFKYAADDFAEKKDFKSAMQYYKLYFEKGGEEAAKDDRTTFNAATAARKLKDNVTALEYYKRSVELNYRADIATYYEAVINKENGDEEKMKEILSAAIVKYADSRFRPNMVKLLTVPMLKDATEPFTKANELSKAATGGDPANYIDNMGKAIVKYQETIPLLEKVLEVDPANENALTYKQACEDNIKAFNDYKASLEKK